MVCAELGISTFDLSIREQVEEANRACGFPGTGSLATQVMALVRAVTMVDAVPVEADDGVQVVDAVLVEEPVQAPPLSPVARAADVLRSVSEGRRAARAKAEEARAAARAAAATARERTQAAATAVRPAAETGPMPALTMTHTPLVDTFGIVGPVCCFINLGCRLTPLKLVVFQFLLICLWVGFGFQAARYDQGSYGEQNTLYPYPAPPPPPYPSLPSGHPDECPFDVVACNLHCAELRDKCGPTNQHGTQSACMTSRSAWSYDAFMLELAAARKWRPATTELEVMLGMPGTLLNASDVNDGICQRAAACEVSCACGVDARHVATGGDCQSDAVEWPWFVGVHLAGCVFLTLAFLYSWTRLAASVETVLGAPRIRHGAPPPVAHRVRLHPPPPPPASCLELSARALRLWLWQERCLGTWRRCSGRRPQSG